MGLSIRSCMVMVCVLGILVASPVLARQERLLASPLSSSTGSESGPPQQPAAARPSGPTGTIEIGDTTFEFLINRCDLTGGADDGILLRGSTVPGGRRLFVEVERLGNVVGAGTVAERVTLRLSREDGGMSDEWEAARQQGIFGTGRWTRAEGAEQADGPLLRISGTELVAADLYTYSRGMSARELQIPREMSGATPERRRELDSERRRLRELRDAARETQPGTLRAACPAPVTP